MRGRQTTDGLLAELQATRERVAQLEDLARRNERQAEERADELSKRNAELRRLVAEREAIEAERRRSEESYRSFVEHSAEGIWKLEFNSPIPVALPEDEQIRLFYERSRLTECNHAMARMYGVAPEELVGSLLGELLVPTDEHNITFLREFIRSGYRLADAESHEVDAEGDSKYFLNNLTGVFDGDLLTGAWGTQRDITEKKRAGAVASGQQEILEMIARGVPSDDVLGALVSLIERESKGARCSVLLLEAGAQSAGVLRHAVAPHLPAAFVEAVSGLPVAEGVGVCGTSAHRKETVIVADVITDPLTASFRELAARHSIGACWSAPIFSGTGAVLGTFAMYYEGARAPSPRELSLIEISSRLAGIAIERHRAEQELKESEARFHSLAEGAPVGIFRCDLEGRCVYANRRWCELSGLRTEEGLGWGWSKAVHPEDLPALVFAARNAAAAKAPVQMEHRLLRQDGTTLWVHNNAVPERNAQGEVTGYIVTVTDITERQRAEEALRESEANLRLISDTAFIAILTVNEDGKIVFVNAATEQMFGYSEAEMMGADLTMLMPEYLRHLHEEGFKRYKETGVRHLSWDSVELPGLHKNGSEMALEIAFGEFTKGGRQYFTGKARDITWRKAADDALRASEAKFRAIAESSPAAIMIYRPDALVYVNPAAMKITGYSEEELLRMTPFDALHPDWQNLARQRAQARLLGEDIARQIEYKIVTRSGEERWVEFTVGDFINYEGERLATGSFFDVTDRKRAEELLANEKERLSVTLRSIGDGVIATDTAGTIIFLNKAAETMTGWKQAEAVGRPLGEVFHIINEKTRERRADPTLAVLRTGRGTELENGTILVSRGGVERVIADSVASIYDRESRVIGIVLVFRDQTEERQREEELLKASKLESIGLLAGGIAHDFNNILTAILGNVSLARLLIEPGSDACQRLDETEQATLRARDLTQQLLTFARGGSPVKKTASIARLVREGVNFALTGSNIECVVVIPDDLWLAEIDEGQINQVVHNLVLNARQAMPLGGKIEVRAQNVSLAAGETIHGARLGAGDYVKITVTDQGVGIPEEYIGKIFDPYFTTKQKGSGLGLATSYSIVRNHGGYIFVESRPGEGTMFSVYLPASEKNELSAPAPSAERLAGSGKILVMDDEQVLRDMIADMLGYLGYSCEGARSGEEAIEVYRKARDAGEPFDAVIVDLTVPGGMGGQEAVRRLREMDPNVKCVVSSGYSNDPIMAEYRRHGFVAVIAKPYQISELNEVLNGVLERR